MVRSFVWWLVMPSWIQTIESDAVTQSIVKTTTTARNNVPQSPSSIVLFDSKKALEEIWPVENVDLRRGERNRPQEMWSEFWSLPMRCDCFQREQIYLLECQVYLLISLWDSTIRWACVLTPTGRKSRLLQLVVARELESWYHCT
jgi:hypothetical protein